MDTAPHLHAVTPPPPCARARTHARTHSIMYIISLHLPF